MNHNAYARYEMRKVQSLTQDESLRARERHTISRIPLVTMYNPRTSYIAEVATGIDTCSNQRKVWLAYLENDQLSHIGDPAKRLRDIIVSAKLTGTSREGHTMHDDG